MLQRQEYMSKITDKLAILSHKIELNACLNLTDINIHAEYFFCELLNLVYGLSLINLNTVTINAKSIDLMDTGKRVAFQITSTSDFKKIKHTIDGFVETDNINNIDRLIVLILTKKKKYKAETYGEKFVINISKDVWDHTTLIKDINNLPNDKMKSVYNCIISHIPDVVSQKAPKEVATIIGMIKILSQEDHPLIGNGFIEEPDPDRKINKRFAAYARYLMDIYTPLMSIYAGILNDISQNSDAGMLNINKLSAYLKRFSNIVLDECNDDPVRALNKMTDYYSTRLIADGVDYDDSAIQYYLIDNMIRCNVFPNKVESVC